MMFSIFYNSIAFAGEATLAWYPSDDPNLGGYIVHYGKSSGNYGNSINVGYQTSHTITGLGNGTYYFAVTAYDTSGNQSAYSNEASKTFSGIQSTDSSGSSGSNMSGGCGMIDLKNGKPPGPGQAADMVGLLVGLLIYLLINITRNYSIKVGSCFSIQHRDDKSWSF